MPSGSQCNSDDRRKCCIWSIWQTTSIWCWNYMKMHVRPAHQPLVWETENLKLQGLMWSFIFQVSIIHLPLSISGIFVPSMLVASFRCLLIFKILVLNVRTRKAGGAVLRIRGYLPMFSFTVGWPSGISWGCCGVFSFRASLGLLGFSRE